MYVTVSYIYIYRLDSVRALYGTLGLNVLMLEYRGYGKSTDSPTEKGDLVIYWN